MGDPASCPLVSAATDHAEIDTLSLHDALPISPLTGVTSLWSANAGTGGVSGDRTQANGGRSEEHTSELQSQFQLVCRLLLEKKKARPAAGCPAYGVRRHSGRAPLRPGPVGRRL